MQRSMSNFGTFTFFLSISKEYRLAGINLLNDIFSELKIVKKFSKLKQKKLKLKAKMKYRLELLYRQLNCASNVKKPMP